MGFWEFWRAPTFRWIFSIESCSFAAWEISAIRTSAWILRKTKICPKNVRTRELEWKVYQHVVDQNKISRIDGVSWHTLEKHFPRPLCQWRKLFIWARPRIGMGLDRDFNVIKVEWRSDAADKKTEGSGCVWMDAMRHIES